MVVVKVAERVFKKTEKFAEVVAKT